MANLLTREAIATSGSMDLDGDGFSYFHNIGKEPYWSLQAHIDPGQSADGYLFIQASNNKANWVDMPWGGQDGYVNTMADIQPGTGLDIIICGPGVSVGFIRLRYAADAGDGTLSYAIHSSKGM